MKTIYQQTGISVSNSSLCRSLQQLNLTRKKTLHATQAETERVQNMLCAVLANSKEHQPGESDFY